jgi:membrane protein YdbS with pleckstrin-like domain
VGGEPVSPAPDPGRQGRYDDPDFVPAGGYRRENLSFDDEPTAYQDLPDDFDDDPRYGGRQSRVDGSFVVGEPITEEELGGLRGGTTPLVTSRRVVPLEDEASTLVQRYLFPTEKFRGEWKRHPIQLAKEIGIAAGVTIVVGLLAGYLARRDVGEQITGFLVLAWLGVIVWAAWKIVDWWFDRFILTNKRVMVVSGVITRNVAMMPLQRVTDMKYVQSALGRVLNYGTFELESAGQDQALRSIPHLPSPNELYLRIVEEMYEPEAVEARLAGAQDVIDDGT